MPRVRACVFACVRVCSEEMTALRDTLSSTGAALADSTGLVSKLRAARRRLWRALLRAWSAQTRLHRRLAESDAHTARLSTALAVSQRKASAAQARLHVLQWRDRTVGQLVLALAVVWALMARALADLEPIEFCA